MVVLLVDAKAHGTLFFFLEDCSIYGSGVDRIRFSVPSVDADLAASGTAANAFGSGRWFGNETERGNRVCAI